MLTQLKVLNPNMNPASIMTDFEKASINAFAAVFPTAERHGCYFHFSQCIWRQIQQMPEVLRSYIENTTFALHIRFLAALAFIPEPDIEEAFEAIQDSPFFVSNTCTHDLLDYMERTWIGKPFGRSRRRRDPLFPKSLWNCFLLTADGLPRTNNSVEGWHREFGSLLGADHPNLWKFIDALRKEQGINETKIEQYLAGQTPPPSRKRYRELAARLLAVVEDYGNRSVLEYLKGIASNLQLNV